MTPEPNLDHFYSEIIEKDKTDKIERAKPDMFMQPRKDYISWAKVQKRELERLAALTNINYGPLGRR